MSNHEKDDERLAKKWLESQGYSNVERVKNDPPDYVVDSKYAIEVRRLNRGIQVNGRTEGEENSRIPLRRTIEKALGTLDAPGKRRSLDVNCEYDFSRPLPESKVIKKQIHEALLPLTQPYDTDVISQIKAKYLDYYKHARELDLLFGVHLCLPCGICLELGECSMKPAQFRLLNISDGRGVLVLSELKSNLEAAIREKSQKIKSRGNDFEEWWLILIDHIGYVPNSGLNETELEDLRAGIHIKTPWLRIIIVSLLPPYYGYEL